MNCFRKIFFLLSLITAIHFTPVSAQEKQSPYLQDLFSILEKKHQVTFLYDSDLLTGVKTHLTISGLNLENALVALTEKTAFNFIRNRSTIVVTPHHPGKNIKACGILADEETKEPIPMAIIYNSAENKGIFTDEKGAFIFYTKLSDTTSFSFSFFGYELQKIRPEYFNGKDCHTIFLKSSILELEAVTIKSYLSSGIDYRLKDNAIIVKPNEMGLLPGETDADILMSIEALPGINSPDSKAGNLNIRGSSPDQTLILFDNIPIYHKGHYFGTLSPYNPMVVEDVVVQRGPYLADKGGRIGGVIEINSKKRIPDSTHCGVGISSTNASAYTHFPLIKNKLAILLAGRNSYPSAWVSPKQEVINEFIYQESEIERATLDKNLHLNTRDYLFQDFNGKIISKPSKKDELTGSFLFVKNKVVIEIFDDVTQRTGFDDMHLINYGYSLDWSRKWSPLLSTKVTGTQSFYSQSYNSDTYISPDSIIEDAFYKNQLHDINLKILNIAEISQKSSIDFGYDGHLHEQSYRDYTFLSGPSKPTDINRSNTGYLHSIFTNYTLTNISNYIFNIGLRGNYFTLQKNISLEPRIMASYFLTNNITLKSSAGIYNQFIMQIPGYSIRSVGGIENLLWILGNGKDLPVVRSEQAMLGTIFKRKSWIIDVEAYFKDNNNLSINNFKNPKSPNRFFYGNGNTIGIDFLIKKQWKRINTWVSYTLSRTEVKFDSLNQGNPFVYINDQTHVLDLVATYKLKRWKFSAGWKYRTGLSTSQNLRTPIINGPTPSNPGSAPPPPPNTPVIISPESDPHYTDRFPDFHQLDISVVYSFPKKTKGWNGNVGLSLLNVYNRKNVFLQIRRPAPGPPGTIVYANKYAIGFAPNLTLSVNW